MHPYLMKNFVFNSFLLFCLLWLFSAVPVHSQSVDNGLAHQNWIPPLGNNFEKALFKGSMDISKHHLTGLLFFKQTYDTSLRIIFINEVGMKFFDLEFTHEQFIIHYCFPSLSRKGLLKILESDFRLLLPEKLSGQRKIILKTKNTETSEYKVKSKSGKYFFTIENGTRRILKIVSSGKFVRKTRIFFDQSANNIPPKIKILNPTIKLTLKLTLLDK